MTLTTSFSYDGDEVSTKHEPIPRAEELTGTSQISHIDESNSGDQPMLDLKEEPPSHAYDPGQTHANGTNGDSGLAWPNEELNGAGTLQHDFGNSTVESESHGTGIKEDG